MADGKTEEREAGGRGFVIVLLALMVVGALSGAGFGVVISRSKATVESKATASGGGAAGANTPNKHTVTAGGGKEQYSESEPHKTSDQIIALDPILVTLAGSRRSWLRLEAAIVFASPGKDDRVLLAKVMTEDIMSFLRTLNVAQLETVTGLEFLREDLAEIVRLRSKGRASGIIIRAMMIE